MRPLYVLVWNAAAAFMAAFESLFRLVVRAKPVEWVVYELDGPVERGPTEDWRRFVFALPKRPKVRALSYLRTELAHLTTVDSLRGVILRFGELDASPAIRDELRDLIREFRGAGKRVEVHADGLDLSDFWVASAADRIWLTPRGRLELSGLGASSFAGARLLRKFGVSMEVVKAGSFKSAGETFGADHVSDAQKEQTGALLDDLLDTIVTELAEDRAVDEAVVKTWIDEGPCTARLALERGAIHGTCYADELRHRLGAEFPPPGSPDAKPVERRARIGPFAAVLATHPVPVGWLPLLDRRPSIVSLAINGTIIQGRSRATRDQVTAGSDSLVPALHGLRRDESVKAVVLHISSPGGSALASDLIWHAAKRLAESKPVVAYFEDVSASGGYYIGAAARRIVASRTCITGSIGVFMARPDVSEAFKKLEVDHAFQSRGRHAGALRPDVPLSDADRRLLQRDVDETYNDFLSVVAEGRGLTVDEVRPLAEGRVWLAPRAVDHGLVDALGSLDDALGEAIGLAGLEGPVAVHELDVAESGWRAIVSAWRRGESRLSEAVGRWVAEAVVRRLVPGWTIVQDGPRAEWPGSHPLERTGR